MKQRLIQRISGHESSSSASSTKGNNFNIKALKKQEIIKTEYFNEMPIKMTDEDKGHLKELIL